MGEQRVWSAYFSPTGTTKQSVHTIATAVAQDLGVDHQVFDFTLPTVRSAPGVFGQGDIVVLGVPVYAGRVPNVLLKYLNTLEGNGALAVPVVSFGNRSFDDALLELRNLLVERGFQIVAAAGVVGEHSFSKILGAGRPDGADLTQAERFGHQISEKIQGTAPLAPPVVEDERVVGDYYKPQDRNGVFIDIRKVKSLVSDSCIRCGKCARLCPMGSINPDNVAEYTGICIKCGACTKGCPTGARYYEDEGYLYHKTELEEVYTRRAEPKFFL